MAINSKTTKIKLISTFPRVIAHNVTNEWNKFDMEIFELLHITARRYARFLSIACVGWVVSH